MNDIVKLMILLWYLWLRHLTLELVIIQVCVSVELTTYPCTNPHIFRYIVLLDNKI